MKNKLVITGLLVAVLEIIAFYLAYKDAHYSALILGPIILQAILSFILASLSSGDYWKRILIGTIAIIPFSIVGSLLEIYLFHLSLSLYPDYLLGTLIMLFLPGLVGGIISAMGRKSGVSLNKNLKLILSILMGIGLFYYLVSLLVVTINVTSPPNPIIYLSPYFPTAFLIYNIFLIISSSIPALFNKKLSNAVVCGAVVCIISMTTAWILYPFLPPATPESLITFTVIGIIGGLFGYFVKKSLSKPDI